MSNPYVPNTDAALDTFLTNYANLTTANPATFGITTGDAVTIAAMIDDWHTAYLAATDGSTRGPMTIAAKDTQRTVTLGTIRPYSQQIANNGAVATSDKIALGLNPRTNPPTKIVAPTTQPVLSLSLAQPFTHLLRYRDAAAAPKSKAKPFGATQLLLFGSTSPTIITDPSVLPYIGSFTKSPLITTWDSSAVGKTVYYAGRWQTQKGLLGPWGAIMAAVVV